MADQLKRQHFEAMGVDEMTIAEENRATLASNLYNGGESSVVMLGKFIKDAEALNIPEEFVMAELEAIAGSENANFSVKTAAQSFLNTMQPERDIRTIDGALIEVTPTGVKELYKAQGVDESNLIENASLQEKERVEMVMNQLPTRLKDNVEEAAFKRNLILQQFRSGKTFQDIVDQQSGFVIADPEDEPLGMALRVMAANTDIDLGGLSSQINRGGDFEAITSIENAKMRQYDDDDFNQAKTGYIVEKVDQVIDLIEAVGENFMGAVDKRLFSADQTVRQRAIEKAGIKEGDAEFAAAIQLGSIMARLMAEERKSFGGTAITDTEAQFLKPMLAELSDQPAAAAVKMAELANAALTKHNFYRDKEGLPVFTDREQILDRDAKTDLYRKYSEKYISEDMVGKPQGVENDPLELGNQNWSDAPRQGDARNRPEFVQGVDNLAQNIGVEPEDIMTVIGIETAGTFDPAIKNPTSSGTGLIQFMNTTAEGLGTTTRELARMTAEEQLEYVGKYFENKKDKINDVGDLYLAIAAPAFLGKPEDTEVYKEGTEAWEKNAGWRGADGKITVASIKNSAISRKGKFKTVAQL